MNFERYSHFSRRNLNIVYIFLGETTTSHKKAIEKRRGIAGICQLEAFDSPTQTNTNDPRPIFWSPSKCTFKKLKMHYAKRWRQG